MSCLSRLIGVSVLLASNAAWAQDELQLPAGTKKLAGSATLSSNTAFTNTGDSITGLQLSILPQAGYFVIENLEVTAGVGAQLWFGDLYPGASRVFGANVGCRYYMPSGLPVLPYGGVSVGMDFTVPEEGATTKALAVAVPIGALLPLNNRVAIDLGVSALYRKALVKRGGSGLFVPFGFVGVQAFF